MEFIIKDKHIVIGSVSVDTRYAFSWEMESIHVHHNYQGLGFGSILIRAAIGYADNHQKNMELIVASGGRMSNQQLTEWYARHGFELAAIGMRRYFKQKGNVYVK